MPIDRRTALAALGLPALSAQAAERIRAPADLPPKSLFIRALTGALELSDPEDGEAITRMLTLLKTAKAVLEGAGYEVQTKRLVLNLFPQGLTDQSLETAWRALPRIADAAKTAETMLSLGQIHSTPSFSARDIAVRIATTTGASCSVAVTTPDGRVNAAALAEAADVILGLSAATSDGTMNFKFAAAANIPNGTPFFPVAHHSGAPCLSIGLETPNLVKASFANAKDYETGAAILLKTLNRGLAPIEALAVNVASAAGVEYLGIDTSPAPSGQSSIGEAIATAIDAPFGSPATLQACAAITQALKAVSVKICGYSGLMLPVLEDPVLAKWGASGEASISKILLFSSVCGTGLDVVPLPGDIHPLLLRRIIGDMATLSCRLRKPLSARLYPIPGKSAGESFQLADPLLFPSQVFSPA